MASAGSGRRVLIIIENLPAPFDRRVWQEATTLKNAGYEVSIVCPRMKGFEEPFEVIDDIEIHRHPLPLEARGALGYLLEYSTALFWEFVYAWRIFLKRGFDIIHACNPPDTIFLVGGFFKLFFRRKFLFDHHDINPELYEAKFGRKDFFHRLLQVMERLTFRTADVSIATNESYRKIAIERGGMQPENVFVVRSGPDLKRLRIQPPKESEKHGRRFLVGYLGTMGKQEGVSYLLDAVKHIVLEVGRTDIHFVMIGGGPELENLRKEAKDKGIDEYVTFTGRVSDQALLDAINTADVCVNPDEYNAMNDKSTMNKVMEYMSLGKPIVQFDLTEGRVSAQEASVYAKRNDAKDLAAKLLDLLGDPDRRKRMGEFGRARVENELQWPYEEPKLLAAYDRLWDPT